MGSPSITSGCLPGSLPTEIGADNALVVAHLLGRTQREKMALVEHDHSVGERQCQPNVVLHKQDSEATLVHTFDELGERAQAIDADAGSRLVEEEQGGLARESTSDLKAAQCTDVQLARLAVSPRRKIDQAQQLLDVLSSAPVPPCEAKTAARVRTAFFAEATWMFSRTVIELKGRATWKVRRTPAWLMCAGLLPCTSLSLKRIVPDVGLMAPAIALNSVVLPAPFGPMTDTISPSATSKLTADSAVKPPKRTVTWSISRRAIAARAFLHERSLASERRRLRSKRRKSAARQLGESAVLTKESLRLEPQHQHQDDSKSQQSVVRDEAEGLGQSAEHERPDEGAANPPKPSEDEHRENHYRLGETEAGRCHDAQERRVQATCHARERSAQCERRDFVGSHGDADRARRLLVVPDGGKRLPEPGTLKVEARGNHHGQHDKAHDQEVSVVELMAGYRRQGYRVHPGGATEEWHVLEKCHYDEVHPDGRDREEVLAITTIGVNFVVVALFQYMPFFGGATGMYAIPLPTIAGHQFDNTDFLIVGLVMLAVVVAASFHVERAWFGQSLAAIRDDEQAACSVGIPVASYKVAAFALSAAFAGMAGSLYAPFLSVVTPTSFGFTESIVILSMLIFGGLGRIRGALVGALMLGALPEAFRFISDYRLLTFGVILVLMLRFQPQGLLGEDSALSKLASRALAAFRPQAPPLAGEGALMEKGTSSNGPSRD